MSNIVIIKHPKCPQTFLFSVPDGCELHTGDFVTVDTKGYLRFDVGNPQKV